MQRDVLLTALLDGRVKALNEAPDAAAGSFVLLWLQGQRRLRGNLAAAHAQRRANELGKPLVVYEAIRLDYPYASDRFHRFVIDGAADNALACADRGLTYGFFLDRPGAPRGVLHALASRAAVVVTDWLPSFIHPAQTRKLAARAPCRVEVVDAAGIAPLSAFPKQELAARTLRPKITRLLPERLQLAPEVKPTIAAPRRFDWPFEPLDLPVEGAALDRLLAGLPIDHAVAPVAGTKGGTQAALQRLRAFVKGGLHGYAEARNQPSLSQTSGLSPYLHFGHLGAAEIALAARGSDAPAADRDAFLEELIVRRELSLNFAARCPQHGSIEAAPGWALSTLRDHEKDPRTTTYTDAELETARTGDEVWNASQRQLLREGRIHGYLRMLWAKNILFWSPNAKEAHRRIAWLNDKYALDGRDAVSATNFLWIFGLHDRPFPGRAIFGTVRSMTSGSARRKLDLGEYLARFGPGQKI